MDGKERMVLVTSDLKLPNNLAIDFDHNDLCWTDAGLHRIECMNLYTKIRNAVYSQASESCLVCFFLSKLPTFHSCRLSV